MTTPLGGHDQAILRAIFNPTLPISDACDKMADASLKDVDRIATNEEQHERDVLARRKQVTAIRMVEEDIHGALTLLNEAITLVQDRPSLYNDRAQVLLLLARFGDAFEDLSHAIRMADERGDQKRTLCAALCQRGVIHRKLNRIALAREDYERAAEMGSAFAKRQLVELNPYAAMCNHMLRHVMQELH